jgi:hypothetical protein
MPDWILWALGVLAWLGVGTLHAWAWWRIGSLDRVALILPVLIALTGPPGVFLALCVSAMDLLTDTYLPEAPPLPKRKPRGGRGEEPEADNLPRATGL